MDRERLVGKTVRSVEVKDMGVTPRLTGLYITFEDGSMLCLTPRHIGNVYDVQAVLLETGLVISLNPIGD